MNNKNFQCLITRSVLLYKAFHKTALLSGFVLIAVVNTNAQSTVQSTLDNLSKDSNSVGQAAETTFYLPDCQSQKKEHFVYRMLIGKIFLIIRDCLPAKNASLR